MPRSRGQRLVAAAVLVGALALVPGLAGCAQDRPARVIGLAESMTPLEDEAPVESSPEVDVSEIDMAEEESVESPPASGLAEAEAVDEEPASEADLLVEESVEGTPVEEPVDAQPEPGVSEDEPQSDDVVDDDVVDEGVVDEDGSADLMTSDELESDQVETEDLEDQSGEVLDGDLDGDPDEEQQEELLDALGELEDGEIASDATDGPVPGNDATQEGTPSGTESLQVESTPIGLMATVNVFTDTRPVGPRLSVTVGLRSGEPAEGAPILVLGEGLAPQTEVTVTVYSTPQVLASGVVDDDGSASLDAALPGGLDPGAHAIDVRATGAGGSAVQSIGAFTIDPARVVEEVAPMGELLDPVPPDDPTLARALSAGVAVYDPARYPTVTVAAAIMAVAVVGIAGLSRVVSVPLPGSPADGNPTPKVPGAEPRRPARLSKMKARKMTSLGEVEQGWGDRLGPWRVPGTAAIDRMIHRMAWQLSRVTELGSRILVDGTWARAMVGSAGLALWLLGAVLGLLAARSVEFGAFPPAAPLVLVIVAVGILDATAGVIAWVVLAVGVVVTGQLGGWDDLRTLLGLFALYAAIPLAANALRPLRRSPDASAKGRFDRLADYVAMPVLIAWAGTSMLLALNGLSGLLLVEDDLLVPMRWTIAVALVLRLALEDLAAHGFPARVEAVQPSKWPVRPVPVQLASIALRVGVVALVLAPFAGLGAATFAAAVLTAIPMLLKVNQDRLVNVPWLYRYFPRGMASRLLTMVVAIYLSAWLLGQAATSEQTPAMYNWLLLPGIIVGVISILGRDGRHWPDTWSKRGFGSLVWFALAGLTVGLITVPLL
jgi:hypothetical protein